MAAAVIGLGAASLSGYRVYHYMMHDNEFCLSCHLMTDAYERFQRSAHNEVSCHSCHPAGLSTVWQLYSTVFLSPTEVRKHAHVSNRTCESCHSLEREGETWERVQRTAGHRVHLESRDSSLRDLKCVDCHSVDVHEFNPTNRTCMKAGCHADAQVKLGRMGSLDIYCTTCHSFQVETPHLAFDSLGGALSPKARDCFACHEMRRALGDMEFTHDPHRGECGMCHNPHTQRQGVEAAQTCTGAGCHVTDWQDSPFHTGVPAPQECVRCHIPHSWKVEGENCMRCHRHIMQPTPPARPQRTTALPAAAHRDLAVR